MTGLEKILKVIEGDALTQAEAIIGKAKKEADEKLQAAKLEADRKCTEITQKSDADVKAALSRAESAAALQEKKKILDAKQQIISNVIIEARNSLAQISDSDYIEIILKMVKKYAHNKAGEIIFSQADKRRLPAGLNERIAGALSGKPNAVLLISEGAAPVESGFILKYGDIEENCSFDALFSSAREEFSDKVNAILFE